MKHILPLAALLLASAAPAQADPIRDQIAGEMPSLMAIYRDLHQHPELSSWPMPRARPGSK
jgi:hypothetical protein